MKYVLFFLEKRSQNKFVKSIHDLIMSIHDLILDY